MTFPQNVLRSRICLAAMLAALCWPAAAQDPAKANPLLPEWLDLGVEARSRTEFRSNINNQSERDDTINWTRLRLNVGVTATPWLRFRFQGQDARVSGVAPWRNRTNVDFFDVREAYVSLGHTDKTQLHVGRQELSYGDDRLIGRRNWHNVDPAWDAARLVLRRGDYRFDVFSMAFVEVEEDQFDRLIQGNRVHGFYGQIGSWLPGGQVEPYAFYASQPRVNGVQDRGPDSGSYTAGVRVAGGAADWLNYDFEFTGQRGHARSIELRGWASAESLSFGNNDLPLRTRLRILHDFASGGDSRETDRQSTFDPLHHARHRHLGIADVVGRRNIHALTIGWEGYLHPRWRLRVNRLDFWLASRFDGLYAINGRQAVAAPVGGAASNKIGSEWDLMLRFAAPIDGLTIEGGPGLFSPSGFLETQVGEFAKTKMVYLNIELQL